MTGFKWPSLLVGGVLAAGIATAAHSYPPNGYGSDPDGDSNPAVNTRLIARIGDAAEAALDPPFKIITFESAESGNGDKIRRQYERDYGVTFGDGLTRQICDGPRYFRYDSECTYMRAPSGRFAALYKDEWGRPLNIEFASPVCAAALALYPTGGREGEAYRIVLKPYAEDGAELPKVKYDFEWTKDTFRWRLMAGAYFLTQKASRVDVKIVSKDDRKKSVRFLIDDVAFIENDCSNIEAEILADSDPIEQDLDEDSAAAPE